jgi:CheY-like chemotaxis protein
LSALLLSSDLFGSSKFVGDAKRAGCQLSIVANPAEAAGRVADSAVVLVVIDLATVKVDLKEFVACLREAASQPLEIIAFGPHVHEDRLQAARDAGCNAVMSRGQFHAQAEALFRAVVERPRDG